MINKDLFYSSRTRINANVFIKTQRSSTFRAVSSFVIDYFITNYGGCYIGRDEMAFRNFKGFRAKTAHSPSRSAVINVHDHSSKPSNYRVSGRLSASLSEIVGRWNVLVNHRPLVSLHKGPFAVVSVRRRRITVIGCSRRSFQRNRANELGSRLFSSSVFREIKDLEEKLVVRRHASTVIARRCT